MQTKMAQDLMDFLDLKGKKSTLSKCQAQRQSVCWDRGDAGHLFLQPQPEQSVHQDLMGFLGLDRRMFSPR